MRVPDTISNRRLQQWRGWLMHRLRVVPRLWREAAPVAAPAMRGLDIALTPSPLARRALTVLLAAQLLYAIELLLLQHVAVASAVLALVAALFIARRRAMRSDAAMPRRLLLLADGRLRLLLVGGAVERATLLPQSLQLGSWLLLVLRAGGRTHRLLIGPDNLGPAPLASLRRRVRAASAGSLPGYITAQPVAPRTRP